MQKIPHARRFSRRALAKLALFTSGLGLVGPRRAVAFAPVRAVLAEEAQTETLLALTLPAGLAPVDEIHFFQLTEAAGVTMAYPSFAPMRSLSVATLLSGQSVSSGDSPRAAHHSGQGQFEPVAPRAELTLGPGDQVVAFDEAASLTIRHPGSETRSLYLGFYAATPKAADSDQSMPSGATIRWLYDYYPSKRLREALASAPLAVTFTREIVPPGMTLPASNEPYPLLRFVQSGIASWQVTSTGGEMLSSDVVEAGQKLRWRALKPNQRLIISNPGSGPLVLLAAEIGPAAGGSSGLFAEPSADGPTF